MAAETLVIPPIGRKIHLIGVIDEESLLIFCSQLSALELESKKSITLEFSSPGGSAYDALAFSARIRSSPCDIIINAYGLIASAAVLILAAGDSRRLAKEAWVMVHEDSGEHGGNTTELARSAKHLVRLENQWAQLLADVTTADEGVWRDLHHRTTYLTADEALDLGLVDELF